MKQEMLHILIITVRQIIHACICHLKLSNPDVQQEYNSKKGVNLFILDFRYFAFWTENFRTVCSCHVTMCFRVNPDSIVTWMSRNFLLETGAKSEFHLKSEIWSFAKWLNVCLGTKRLWVRLQLQSLKFQISHWLWARSSLLLDIQATIECGFTLKHLRDTTRT